jgi:hypothetical protein
MQYYLEKWTESRRNPISFFQVCIIPFQTSFHVRDVVNLMFQNTNSTDTNDHCGENFYATEPTGHSSTLARYDAK